MKHRCQALDSKGNQCKSQKTKTKEYHGDNEIYDGFNDQPTWVKVWLCKKHSKEPLKNG